MRLLKTSLLATLLASSAATTCAQSFDGSITRDPNAGLAIYDFNFNGPSNGLGALYLGPTLMVPAFQLPIGSLYLMPPLLPLSPILPMDPLGQGQFRFTVPLPVVDGLALAFQPVFIDLQRQNTVRLSNRALSLGTGASPRDLPFDYAFGYGTEGNMRFTCGAPAGTRVEVRLVNNGNVRAGGQTMVGANGRGSVAFNAPGGVQRGDQVEVLVDGQPHTVIPVTAR